jgi:hypothetical protein
MIDEQAQEKVKRKFNKMVDNPMLEDYSLRYAPRSFRKWSECASASAALGGIALRAVVRACLDLPLAAREVR